MILNGLPWKQTSYSVIVEIEPRNCILDCFVDYEGYSISSKRFLPAVVDIMVIWVKFTQTLKGRSGSVSVASLGPGAHNVCLWPVWGLVLNAISPLLLSCWSFSFGCGVSFFGRIQHSPVDGCSAVSSNLGVLAGDDEHAPFYSAILE